MHWIFSFKGIDPYARNRMTTQLSASQYVIHHTEGRLNWFPDNIKGGARKKVIDALSNRALITRDGCALVRCRRGLRRAR